jgi:hypothetical protein
MPVFFKDARRILYIHVPKAGGTSIETFFEANGFYTHYIDRGESFESLNGVRRCSPQHMHAALLQLLFDPDRFDYVFMTVRHPVRRLLSKFVMETGETENVERLEDWILRDFSKVFSDPGHLDNHLRPQCDFILPQARIFKLEDGFGEAFVTRLEVESGFDFPQRAVAREMHAGLGAPDFEAVRPAIRDLILGYYAKDFDIFGYN